MASEKGQSLGSLGSNKLRSIGLVLRDSRNPMDWHLIDDENDGPPGLPQLFEIDTEASLRQPHAARVP